MSDDLQQKIDTWWDGLPEKERAKWWSEGDKYTYGFSVYEIKTLTTDEPPRDLYQLPVKPAPCPQFWWKLEAWLGDSLWSIDAPMGIEDFTNKACLPDWWYYKLSYPTSSKSNPTTFGNKDRRQALLYACLAVQRGKG